jgi:hypothetical protein
MQEKARGSANKQTQRDGCISLSMFVCVVPVEVAGKAIPYLLMK